MAPFSPVTHVIFDLDGLLLDTESIYKEGIEETLKEYGKTYTDDVRLKVVGTKEQDTARILVEELGIQKDPEEFYKECKARFGPALSLAKLKPGAERLVQHLKTKSVPIALATSSGQASVDLKLSQYPALRACFAHLVMGSSDSEVVNGKPAPDIFLIAANRFPDSPKPEKCLVFEDSYNGVLAARAACMQVVMVPEEGLVSEEKQRTATQVLKSLEDFVPADFGLCPFDN